MTSASSTIISDEIADAASDIRETTTLLAHINRRAWPKARAEVTSRLVGLLEALSDRIRQRSAQLEQSAEDVVRPQPDWLGEFAQLDAEFGAMKVDWKEKCLSVVTEPITLNDVEFGSFAIEFHWERLGRRHGVASFDVVALDPHPAECNDAITHPHVRDLSLCAGDAQAPVESALEHGRLADAVLLIASVLAHYNPASAYVRLDDWTGATCHDCGVVESLEELSFCEECTHDFCCECITCCQGCGRSLCDQCNSRCDICRTPCCAGCLTTSAASDRQCCSDCLATCSACDQQFAADELVDGSLLCSACAADLESNEPTTLTETTHEADNASSESHPAATAVDLCPVGLAETPILLPRG